MSVGMEGCGPNPRTYSKAEYDALHAEAEALLPVTHWMPLPAAPALAASTGQEVGK